MTSDQLCLIALGANLPLRDGDREGGPAATLDAAVKRLEIMAGTQPAVSAAGEPGRDYCSAFAVQTAARSNILYSAYQQPITYCTYRYRYKN